jgi:hypothetical protein
MYRYERFGFGAVQVSCLAIKYISITKPKTYQLSKVMVLQDTLRYATGIGTVGRRNVFPKVTRSPKIQK